MTAQQRRKRRMIRRFAPTVALCAVIAIIAAACVCALARPVERDTQPEAASTETVAAATKIAPAITKAAEQITKTPETIMPEVPEETEPEEQPEEAPEEQPEEAPEEISRYAALNVTEDDIDMLAALAWHEARGEPFDGQVAVVMTALNRCLSPEFPDTVEEVVFQKYGDVWQFSPAPYLWTAEPTQTQYDAVYTALHDTDYILPAEAVFFSTKAYNDNIVAVIGNHIFCSIEEVTQ
jgi:N-acetylmuramoyl-L-alanine amidase